MSNLPILAGSEVSMLPDGLSAAYLAPADMRDDLAAIPYRTPIVKANGQRGAFFQDGEEVASTLTGCFLHAFLPQSWFAPKNQSPWFSREQKMQWPGNRPICSSTHITRPPRLHSGLTDEQRAEVIRRGAGSNCVRCPLRQPIMIGDTQMPRLCDQSRRLLFASRELGPEPIWLQINGWQSIKTWDSFYNKSLRGATLYAFDVALGFEAVTNLKGNFYKLTIEKREQMPEDQIPALEAIRQRYLHMADEIEDTPDDDPEATPSNTAPWASDPQAGNDGLGMDDIPF